MYPIYLLFIILTFLPCTAAVAMTVEEAGKALSSENKETQLKAEKFLKAKGWEAIENLSQLAFSENRVQREKAVYIWQWIMYGITDELPEGVRQQLLTFNRKGPEGQRKILESIQSKNCLLPTTAACLHSRVLELPYDRARLFTLTKISNNILNTSLDRNRLNIKEYDCRLLRMETCAIIVNLLKTFAPHSLYVEKAYPKWLATHKDLRYSLNAETIDLELNRINLSERYQEAFSLLIGIHDYKVQEVIIETLNNWHRGARDFHLDQLSVDEAAGYMVFEEVVCGNNNIYDTYLRLLKKYPTLSVKMSPKHTVLEVRRLLDEGKFYPAFDYISHKFSPKTDGTMALDPASLQLLGKWAASNLDALTNGLPKLEKESYREILPFLGGLAPMYNLENPEQAKKSAQIFNTLELRTPEDHSWIPALKFHEYRDHFNFQMGLRGKLQDTIEQFRNENIGDHGVHNIGTLLTIHPEWVEQIDINRMKIDALQEILESMCSTRPLNYNNLLNANKIASIWEKTYPELLTDIKKRLNLTAILALRLRDAGETQKGIDQLATSKVYNYYFNAFYLAIILKDEPEFDIQAHFSKNEVSTELIKYLIQFLFEGDNLKLKHCQYGMELLTILVNHPDYSVVDCPFVPHEGNGSKVAYKLWKNGHTDLVYPFMEINFWYFNDPTYPHMLEFPEIARRFGRVSEAIDAAGSFKEISEDVQLRLAYLLRAAGKSKEASEIFKKFTLISTKGQLCLENRDWVEVQSIIQQYNYRRMWYNSFSRTDDKDSAYKDAAYKDAMNAWYSFLRNDKEAASSYLKSSSIESPLIELLLGKYSDVYMKYVKDYSFDIPNQMAQVHRMLAHYEHEIETAIEAQKPISLAAASFYLDNVKYLPNKALAIELTNALGKLPFDNGNYALKELHHIVADFRALVVLGKTNLAKHQLRSLLKGKSDFSTLTDYDRNLLMKGVVYPLPYVPAEFAKLILLDDSQDPIAERLIALMDQFSSPDRLQVVSELLARTRRHKDKFDHRELACLALFYSLALHQNSVHLETLLMSQSDPLDAVELKLGNCSLDKQINLKHQFSPNVKLTLVSKPGNRYDPRSDDFDIVDGIYRVNELWNAGKEKEARVLLNDITFGVILRGVEYGQGDTKKTVQPVLALAGEHPFSFTRNGMIAPLYLFRIFDMPRELVNDMTGVIARMACHARRGVEDIYEALSALSLHDGDYAAAERYYTTFMDFCIASERYDFDNSNIPKQIAHFHDLKLLLALQENNEQLALSHLRQRMQLDPYDLDLIRVAVTKLTAQGKKDTIHKFDCIITDFWENKLSHLPDFPLFQEALADWKSTLGH